MKLEPEPEPEPDITEQQNFTQLEIFGAYRAMLRKFAGHGAGNASPIPIQLTSNATWCASLLLWQPDTRFAEVFQYFYRFIAMVCIASARTRGFTGTTRRKFKS
jgi:hypothetical protein